MAGWSDQHRREALSEFLGRSRKALTPPAGGRRRTPGWRREEVAVAAGISTTWYTWLEQGRDVRMSDHAVARLARALRLDAVQTRYLFELARPREASAGSGTDDPELTAFVEGLSPLPAYALDRGWTVVAVNAAAHTILALTPGENVIEKLFVDPGWRSLFENWTAIASSSAAQYRAAVGGRAEYGPAIARLRTQSPEFEQLWTAGAVAGAPLWRKVFRHPVLGRMTMRFASLTVDGDAGTTVSIYTPVDMSSRAALAATERQESA